MSKLATAGGDEEKQPAAVEMLLGFPIGLYVSNVGIGEWHGYFLVFLGWHGAHINKKTIDLDILYIDINSA